MGIQSGSDTLQRVLVRPPTAEALSRWADYGWHDAPDPVRAADEHERFREALSEAGAEVVVATEDVPADPDAIYAYDPALLTDDGAVLLSMGKPARRAEPDAMGRQLAALGIASMAAVREPATAEGGDMFWLDQRTLLAGISFRTNQLGLETIRRALGPSVDVLTVDLPYLNGPGECLHLMSLLSPLDRDLAVAYLPLMPVRLVTLLRDRGIELIEVPDEEFDTMGPNVLALAPRLALALEGNLETRRRMEAHGVEVRTYVGDEISRKGDGGPTCLTRPLVRG